MIQMILHIQITIFPFFKVCAEDTRTYLTCLTNLSKIDLYGAKLIVHNLYTTCIYMYLQAALPHDTYELISGGATMLGEETEAGWAIFVEGMLTFILVFTVLLTAVDDVNQDQSGPAGDRICCSCGHHGRVSFTQDQSGPAGNRICCSCGHHGRVSIYALFCDI